MTEEQKEKVAYCRKEITKILAAAKSGVSVDDLIPHLEVVQDTLDAVLGEDKD